MLILVVNAGSSTYKLSLFNIINDRPVDPMWNGVIDWGQSIPSLSIQVPNKQKINQNLDGISKDDGLQILLESLWKGDTKVISGSSDIERVGHRVVHGGRELQKPILITPRVKEQIKKLIPLAPLHNPADLEGIKIMEKHFPDIPQVAVFDTAFHANMPDVAKTYPLPMTWMKDGIQRFGFHGISHQYCSERAAKILNKDINTLKIINCHLGNGSSVCAIKNGVSIDTSMGFTPMEGLMMGTRCGSIDPGILLYLLREKKQTIESLDEILNFKSGLKGICGTSDMREIVRQQELDFKLAFDMYVYRLKSYIGAYIAQLEGADVISFTAGIGENSVAIRENACKGLEFMGVEIDKSLNENCVGDEIISKSNLATKVLVIHTKEEWMIAKFCFNIKF
ncbi:MAG: acetate kinase [Parachlamydiaceae bacterium]|nr:acetate kinase [Parachlamydiaceae bacterium]